MNLGEKIVYYKNDELLTELDVFGLRKLPPNIQAYLTDYQPFTKVGQRLTIFLDEKKYLQSGIITHVERERNVLYFDTANSKYSIQYDHVSGIVLL